MREVLEFRIPEEQAQQYLPDDVGQRLESVRRVRVSSGDPLAQRIELLQRRFLEKDDAFFYGWNIDRSYTPAELAAAQLFHVVVTAVFEPAGEECGTEYDDKDACPECGAGAARVSPLRLKSTSLPRRDWCVTIAGEHVVTPRVRDVFERGNLSGVRFEPVEWSSRATNTEDRFQPVAIGPRMNISRHTQVGDDLFSPANECACSRGDTIGLNVFSEVWVEKEGYTGVDFSLTDQHVGTRRGLLRPRRLVLLSPRAWRGLAEAGVSGVHYEVAHFADEAG